MDSSDRADTVGEIDEEEELIYDDQVLETISLSDDEETRQASEFKFKDQLYLI